MSYNYMVEVRTLNGFRSYIYKVYKEEDNKQIIVENKKFNEEEFNKLINSYEIINIECIKEVSFIYNKRKYKVCFYEDKSILEIEDNCLDNSLIIPENLKIYNKEKGKCRKKI